MEHHAISLEMLLKVEYHIAHLPDSGREKFSPGVNDDHL